MAEKPMAAAVTPPAQPQPTLGPNVVHASRVAITYGPVDVNISFATARTTISSATGQPSGQEALEWVVTMGMSPTLAEQLLQVIAAALEDYRKKFGAIPKDPNFKINTAENAEKK